MDELQRQTYYNNISIGIEPVFVVGFKRCNMCVRFLFHYRFKVVVFVGL